MIKEPNDYSIVASARGQKVLSYEFVGGYEGDWLLVSADASTVYFYKGCYGSCTGCDQLESVFGYGWNEKTDSIKEQEIKDFAASYKSFIEIDKYDLREMMREFNDAETQNIWLVGLVQLLPANFRNEWLKKEPGKIVLDITLANIARAIKNELKEK